MRNGMRERSRANDWSRLSQHGDAFQSHSEGEVGDTAFHFRLEASFFRAFEPSRAAVCFNGPIEEGASVLSRGASGEEK